jgi:hypothetical protein
MCSNFWSGDILKTDIWKGDNEARDDNMISLSEIILKVEKKERMKNNARIKKDCWEERTEEIKYIERFFIVLANTEAAGTAQSVQ